MAESNVEPEPDWSNELSDEDTFFAMERLLTTLRALEAELRQQEISELSSTEYCDNFCQALMYYAGSRNSVEHGLPLLEVYCLSINCFTAARPHLTQDSENVALVLKRLALSCFELLLSVPENEIPYEAWVQFHHSVQMSHDGLLEYGSTDLAALLQITGEGGAWSNPVLSALLSGQNTSTEDVDAYIALEGEGFMEMRVNHLKKVGEVAKAVVLAKACTDCELISNQATFRQTYVTLLCQLLPSEEAIMEISRLNCKDVLDITRNLETEGEENIAFILCTTFLTRQLQQQSLYCSWELTLLWSKLQRRIDPSLESLLERCLQLGAIAKTGCHLLYLVRVIGAEAEQFGLATSVELCVKALQLPMDEEDGETRISVCRTISCLLPDDLEVQRACQLTEFLLEPSLAAFSLLQELHQRPDQKYDQENAIIPNSLRCELFLVLKAQWPFDPEFWNWNMLRRHCLTLLGIDSEEEGGQEAESSAVKTEGRVSPDFTRGFFNGLNGSSEGREETGEEKDRNSKLEKGEGKFKSVQGSKSKDDLGIRMSDLDREEEKSKRKQFSCLVCNKSVAETRILHHSKRHIKDDIHTCPVCLETFSNRKDFTSHARVHLTPAAKKKKKKEADVNESMEEDDSDEMEPGEIAVDPSLMLYYQSTHDPQVLEHILKEAKTATIKPADEEHITFNYISAHFDLQNRDVYPCPSRHCPKVFKNSNYHLKHIKSEEHVGDEDIKYYMDMKNLRMKCPFCRRHFMSTYHFRKHRKVHKTDKNYTCLVTGCSACFKTSNELILHKRNHDIQVSYECELKGCDVAFNDLGNLYHHEAQHFFDAAYTCPSPNCTKFYLSKKEFIQHLATHSITFSDEDFVAQREIRRKFLDADPEEMARFKKCADVKLVKDETVNDDCVSSSFSAGSASTSHASVPKQPKGTVTAVAVCFDGKKFTCGFERCGMSFTRARDVLRHLKVAHPEHLKSENKEHKKHDKERGSTTKGPTVAPDPDTEETNQNKVSTSQQSKGMSQEKPVRSHKSHHNTTSLSSPVSSNDPFRDILIGLSQLSLNASCEPPCSESSSPQRSVHLDGRINTSPVPPLQKKSQPRVGEREKVTSKTDILAPFPRRASTEHLNICKVEGCGFRSVTSYTLLKHYCNKHHFDMSTAKSMVKMLQRFLCDLCPKSYIGIRDLKAHYIKTHKFTSETLDEFNCSLKRPIEAMASENPKKLKISKGGKKEIFPWQHRFKKKKANLLRKNGINTFGGKSIKPVINKPSQPPSSVEDDSDEDEDEDGQAEALVERLSEAKGQGSREGSEDEVPRERNGTSRLAAKRNLCYVLTRFKSFHCKNKDCDATFTTQADLLQHLEAAHSLNHSQLSVEKDPHQKNKKDNVRMRPSPPSDDPEPRFRCTINNCNASYHLKSSLVRHTKSEHRSQIFEGDERCEYDGCAKVLSSASDSQNHVLYSRCNIYDSIVVRLQSTHKKEPSLSGCQKKLIITQSETDATSSLTPHRQSLRRLGKPEHDNPTSEDNAPEDSTESEEDNQVEDIQRSAEKSPKKLRRFEDMVFRSHEEALQMCQDRAHLREAYPCMVQGCDTVVKYSSSMRRHYMKPHRMSPGSINTHQDKLMLNVEQLEELIQKKSALTTVADVVVRSPDGLVRSLDVVRSPEIEKQSCDTVVRSSDTGKQSPDAVVRSTDNEKQSRDAVVQCPDGVGRSSVGIGRSPDTEKQSRDAAVHSPEVVQSSDTEKQSPNLLVQSPNAAVRSPNAAVRSPNAAVPDDIMARSSNVVVQSPDDAMVRSPDTETHSPELLAQPPDAKVWSPNVARSPDMVRSSDAVVPPSDAILRAPDLIVLPDVAVVRLPDAVVRSPDAVVRLTDAVVRSPDAQVRAVNGALQMGYQTPEPQSPGGPSIPMNLYALSPLSDDSPDPLDFLDDLPPAEANVMVGELGGHTVEELSVSQNGHAQGDEVRRQVSTNSTIPQKSDRTKRQLSTDASPQNGRVQVDRTRRKLSEDPPVSQNGNETVRRKLSTDLPSQNGRTQRDRARRPVHKDSPVSQKSRAQVDLAKWQVSSSTPCRPNPYIDLSPPPSLRFSIDEGFLAGNKATATTTSAPSPVTVPARQPLKRKNELSEPTPAPKEAPPAPKEPPAPQPAESLISTYKPMGFESSFLKFIQKSQEKKPVSRSRLEAVTANSTSTLRSRDTNRRNCSVKENSQNGLAPTPRPQLASPRPQLTSTRPQVAPNRRTRSSPLKPLPLSITEDYKSVRGLRSILDKALAGCGDLAIKQLQYLRPVVVLRTNANDKLLLGS